MKRFYTLSLFALLCLHGMAQYNFEKGKPDNSNYRYLDDYLPLKEYVDRDKYPNFRMGIAVTVNEYLSNDNVRELINRNAHETVAGNAMKMSSCVDGNGNMNFSRVTNFVNSATEAGVEVYGHTLAWHSQQAVGWLRGMVRDKPAPDMPDADSITYVQIFEKDFRTSQSVGWKSSESQYGYQLSFSSTNGLKIHCTQKQGSWLVQFQSCNGIPTYKNKTYRMTMMVRGTVAGKLHTKLGDWNSGPGGDVAFTTEWKEVTFNYNATLDDSFYLLQCGDYVGDIYIKYIKFEEKRTGKNVVEHRRCMEFEATQRNENPWDNQAWFVLGNFSAGSTYEFSADVRAEKSAKASTQIHNDPTNYVHYEALGDIPFTTQWKTIKLSGVLSKAGKSIALNLSELVDANTYYFDNVSFKIDGEERIKNGDFEGTGLTSFRVKQYGGGVVAPTICDSLTYLYMPATIPLSPQERLDTLVYAMDKWMKGMLQACGGKVKAWDLVNEAISGGGNNGYGYYNLQHSDGYNPNATWDVGGSEFYWQDYMGDIEYVRQACRIARKYGPKDMVLFINDYNLESDWDDNKKLKSLIHWIERWEADGVTKIDGIGTQMHISCTMNDNSLNKRKKHITQMFQLMAATGKYVRVSEFDMGMNDANDNPVSTANMTEAMHKRMADYYEWIVKQYLTIVPPEQQWGICQWCSTDSPESSGWRANTPVGIWDLNYYRKHVYAGWVRGLGGVPNAVKVPFAQQVVGSVYNLVGRRVADSADFESLPAGIYIVDGKKIYKER